MQQNDYNMHINEYSYQQFKYKIWQQVTFTDKKANLYFLTHFSTYWLQNKMPSAFQS